jgi:hypothetical protein
MQTLTVFGPSSDPEHPRSTIEMERYSKQQMKTMSLKREDVVKDASKIVSSSVDSFTYYNRTLVLGCNRRSCRWNDCYNRCF